MFKAGDLLLVPFPFTDQSSAKRRPVLALTAPDAQGDFIGCPITSRGRWANSLALLPADMISGALPLPSWVRTDRVVTLHIGLVLSTFGQASAEFRTAVTNDLCRFIREEPTALSG